MSDRLPPHPDERRALVRRAGLLALFATGLVLGTYGGRRACAYERRAALRAQAVADSALTSAHHMASLAEETAAAVWRRDEVIHRLPPCAPRVRVVDADGGME